MSKKTQQLKAANNASNTVFLSPCGDCWDGYTVDNCLYNGYTLTRVFSTYEDAVAYAKSCDCFSPEDAIVELSVGRL